ncbi:MAG: helix-turn-helix transcriptional regulator [Bacteroidaceae bacterium]|nr:helix-turn-helix transcriptional regulator [Bacteroidaceae bacterium]
MKDRISALMKHMGMSQKDFANEICISPGTLSSIFSGRNNASLNTLNNIHERFPEVNMDWLMNGNGEMFVSGAQVSPQMDAGEAGSLAASSSASGLPLQPGFAEHLSGSQQMHPQTSNLPLEGKMFDRPSRKIAEIRVFYDDGTFETFSAKQ